MDGDIGVTDVDLATGSPHSGDPRVAGHHLIII